MQIKKCAHASSSVTDTMGHIFFDSPCILPPSFQRCQDTSRCTYFTFYTTGTICLQYLTCFYTTGCTDCTTGQPECPVTPALDGGKLVYPSIFIYFWTPNTYLPPSSASVTRHLGCTAVRGGVIIRIIQISDNGSSYSNYI